MKIRRRFLVLFMFLPVLALVGSQLVLVDIVQASPARPGYPSMSLNPTFTSHLISYPTAHSSSTSITNPTYAYDANKGTKAVFSHAVEAGTEYYDLEGFDATVLQDPVNKVDIGIRFSTAATSTATLAIAYHPGVWTLRPSGAGTYTEWTTVTGAATHWEAVDEADADDATTYIETSTNGHKDTFALPDGVVPSGVSISRVTVHVRVYAGGTGRDFYIQIRTHGADYLSSVFTAAKVGGNWIWQPFSYSWTTNPNTASAWTLAEIDALEIGVQNGAAKQLDVTQVYVEVESGSYTDLLPATTAAQALNTYTWKDKTVTKASGLKIKFEIVEDDPVENKQVDVYEVWIVQKIDPSTSFPTPTPNYDAFINDTTFDVNIRANDISGTDYPAGLGGYELRLWYNTTVLTCTGVTYITTWFPTFTEWFKEINDALGSVKLIVSLSQEPTTPGPTGSGDLVTLHFKADQKGASGLYLNETGLGTWETPATPIPHESYDGHYSYRAFDPSTTPMAGFIFDPSSPLVSQAIEFNASTSETTSPSAHTLSGISVTDPAKAYDWDFNTYANFTRNSDGYFELSGFSSPTIPSGFSVFRVDCHIKFQADLSWQYYDQDLYRVYYLVGATTGANLVEWTYLETSLANYTYFDLSEPNDGSWSAAEVASVKLRFETDLQGTAEDLDVNVYEAWLEVQVGGSYARSAWSYAHIYGEGRGWLYSYTWNFDDGNTTTVYAIPTVVHTYDTADTYTVNLTVTDRYGLTSWYTYDVTVIEVVPEFPLGTPLYIVLATVIVFVWWRSRPKNQHHQKTSKVVRLDLTA